MRVALAAYRLMEEIAEADRGVGAAEASLLREYRRALGIGAEDLAATRGTDATTVAIEGDDREREETVRAMARVATVDGRLSEHEREHLLAVAEYLGISRIRAANLLTEAGARRQEGLDAGRAHRRGVIALAVGVLALVAVVLIALRNRGEDSGALQVVAREGDRALVLLQVRYVLERGDQRQAFEGEGSGFFVGQDGLVVTCKHVVQPWKFLADKVQRLDAGWALDPDSIEVTAWPVGARLFDAGGRAFDEAWNTASGTLELVDAAPDQWVTGNRALPGGGRHRGLYHALDNHDLALLRARGDTPRGLELAPADHSPAPLDPVVVLGFPKGADLIEGMHALSAPSTGVIRRVEDSLLISCDIYPGNSGGPLLDAAGRVLGVAARRAGDESLGRCLHVEHVWALVGER